jgi:uncharacterized lipoprotein YajG
MNNKFYTPRLFILFFSILLFASCVAVVGPSVSVPDIPRGDAVSDDEMIRATVSLGSFRDVRKEPETNRISPEGEITSTVRDAYDQSLSKRGVVISESAPVIIHAEVRKWHAVTKGTGEVESDASIYIEVHSRGGERIFTGIYHGSRSSTFPLISAQDIADSLGLSMAQAIDQSLYDRALKAALRGK